LNTADYPHLFSLRYIATTVSWGVRHLNASFCRLEYWNWALTKDGRIECSWLRQVYFQKNSITNTNDGTATSWNIIKMYPLPITKEG